MPRILRSKAISTVRRLGISYLWVDCYCIIQGGNSTAQNDWETEAARMGEVYSNAVLNIGACHVRSPDEGLFSTKNFRDFVSTVIQWRPTSNEGIKPYRMTFGGQSPINSLEESSIMERGWVVQEIVLSRRMLSFNGSTIFWQCSESAASEEYPNDREASVERISSHPFWAITDPIDLLRQVGPMEDAIPEQKSGQVDKRRKLSIQKRWVELMDYYCQAKLSFPDKDKLKALEGVGQRVAQITGDVYQHGLLRYTLPLMLLWELFYDRHTISPKMRRPTWHWASCDNYVRLICIIRLYQKAKYSCQKFSNLAHLFMSDDCQVFTSGSDHTRDFWPSLMCIGRPIALLPYVDWYDHRLTYRTKYTRHINVRLDKKANSVGTADSLVLLPLVIIQKPPSTDGNISQTRSIVVKKIRGLVLRACENHGLFERVGLFKDLSNDSGSTLLKDLKKAKPRLITIE